MALNQLFQGIGAASRGSDQSSPLMDTLAAMNLQDLQKYAQAHKNDAATVALISSIANIKKKAIASEQAQPVNPSQPKIGEQVIAGIAPQPAPQAAQQQLPEDTGIAQLPAQNMQGMAGGGIVAFEEGGQVPRFNGQTGSSVATSPAGEFFSGVKDYFGRISDPATNPRVQLSQLNEQKARAQQGIFEALTPAQKAERQAQVINLDKQIDVLSKSMGSAATPAAFEVPSSTVKGSSDTTDLDKMIAAAAAKSKTKVTADKDGGKDTTDKVSNKKTDTPAAPAAGLAALSDAYKGATAKELGESAKALAMDANKDSEAAYKPYAEMLQKERADLDARKGDNKNMALLQAGLAIMGGTSSNPFENIGKGATQGLTAYQEAKRLDDASKKALMGSEIAMMQAQRAERSGNHKDAVALLGQAEQNKQFGVNAAMKAQELKQTGEYQKGMVGVYQQRNNMLGAGAKHEEKKMAEFGKIQTKILGMLKDDTNYLSLKTDAEREAYKTKLLRAEMMNNPFLSASAANIGFVPAPTGGTQRGDYTDMER